MDEAISHELAVHLQEVAVTRLQELKDTPENKHRFDDEEMRLNSITALMDEEIERLRASHEIELDAGGVWDFVRVP